MTLLVRVAALLVAVGLVLGGLALGSRSDDGGTLVADGTTPVPGTDELVLLCPTDLTDVCEAVGAAAGLATSTQLAAATSAGLVDGQAPDGVWLAPTVWFDTTDDGRSRAGGAALERSASPLAATPLRMVVWQERAAVLAAACDLSVDALDWSCVGEQAGREWSSLPGGSARWGRVRAGHAPPSTGIGLLDTATVAASRAGVLFTLAELQDRSFGTWFRALEGSVTQPLGGRHLAAMFLAGPPAADVAVATQVELDDLPDRDSSFGALTVVDARPAPRLELGLAHPDADVLAAVVRALGTPDVGAALELLGWDRPGSFTDPVASGGALTALRSEWETVRP